MSKFGLYIAVTCARPNLPVQSTISEGVLEAYLAIARAPSEMSGANYDSHGGHLVHSYLADMWRLRLSERFPTGAISSVNALDVPAERIIAEGRIVLVALLLFAVVFDQDPLVPHGTAVFKALVAYAGIAIVLAVTRVWRFPTRPTGLLVHALDIIYLLILSDLAETRDSLFFSHCSRFASFSPQASGGTGRLSWPRPEW